MRSLIKLHSTWLAGMLMFACSGYVSAIGNFKPSPAELAALPAFCAPRAQPYGNQSDHPQVKPWLAIYGQDWIHMHHYCAGMNYINRSYRSVNRAEKENNLRNAVRELDYTVKNSRPDTPLFAEILMARGQALQGLKRTPEAIRDLEKAISIDPNLRRAYGLLVDSHVALKQSDKALKVISEGIRHNPDSTSLKRRYDELGGTKPYPSPYVEDTPEPSPPSAETGAVGPQAESAAARETGVIEEPPAAEVRPPAAPVEVPPIGSPTNPYCRFCP